MSQVGTRPITENDILRLWVELESLPCPDLSCECKHRQSECSGKATWLYVSEGMPCGPLRMRICEFAYNGFHERIRQAFAGEEREVRCHRDGTHFISRREWAVGVHFYRL